MTFSTSTTIAAEGGASEAGIPRPEHPRPDFQRDVWVNLNGVWRFAFDPKNAGEQRRWHRHPHPDTESGRKAAESPTFADPFDRRIVVPFPWESPLSEIGDTEYRGAAWYQRTVTVPESWGETAGDGTVLWRQHPHLSFGAVDHRATVWVDGRFVGEHEGGYTPFSLDLSEQVQPGVPATLTVRAYDVCDAGTPLGKQTLDWYTPSSGIWQTVWLEGRPACSIRHVHVVPRLNEGKAELHIGLAGEPESAGTACRLTVISRDGSFGTITQLLNPGQTEAEIRIKLPAPRAWSPEDPHLYEYTLRLAPEPATGTAGGVADAAADEIHGYFGLRTIERGRWDDKPYEYVLLNGEPIYLRGALDQAFTVGGLHAYPTDDAIRADIQLARDLGLNLLRCHIKVNDPRYYYWADRLGVLILYDLPCAALYTSSARDLWERTFRGALERDFSHPSILAWILFNETWGLEEHQTPASWRWIVEMFDLAKSLDPTRLVEDNSPCEYDHVKTDLNSWHFYIGDYDSARRHVESIVAQTEPGSANNYVSGRHGHHAEASRYRQGVEPLLNSEYAGLGCNGGDRDISYSFKFLTTELRRHPKICGYVYTELTDIEWEHNGFVNYDRSAKEFGYDQFFPGMTVADLNGADFVGLDCPPCQTVMPGSGFAAAAFLSHWDREHPMGDGATLRWRVTFVDRFGASHLVDEDRRAVAPSRYNVVDAGAVAFTLPNEPGLATIAVWVEDASGSIRARNYVNLDVADPAQPPAGAEETLSGWALRFTPADFAAASWPTPCLGGPDSAKFGASDAGWVEYRVPLPDEIDLTAITRLRLLFEAGARTHEKRLGWPRTGNTPGTDHYPQTEALKIGTDLVIAVEGVPLTGGAPLRLPDDPADARGVLSLHTAPSFELGSYGFLTLLEADSELTQRILAGVLPTDASRSLTVRFEATPTTAADTGGGLNLYGARMGAYPVSPTLLLERA